MKTILNSTINMLKSKLILLIIPLFFSCSENIKTTQKPLNVVWISCEDMGPILGSYGNDVVKTPNLDKLAAEGVRYTNAYSTVGVCAPSRFSIITGMYSARLGAHNMRTGDYHNYKTPEQVTYRKDIGVIDKAGKNIPEYEVVPPSYVKPFTEILRANGYYCANNFKCDYQFNAPFTAWDEVSSTVSFRDAPKDKPFFYVWNTLLTHESRIWERSNKPLTVKPKDVEIPSYFPDIPEVRNDIARKYSNIEAMDEKVGEIISQLEEDGLLENTIIMFWSDHGGNLLRQKRAVGNSGLNVPLIIRYPNKIDAGTVDDRIVSLMDLGPTVLSLLNIEPPKHYDGKAIAGEAVKLLFDSGHMTFAKGDSLAVINKYANRINHFHAKDIRSNVINNLDHSKQSFLDAVLEGAFTVPGDGNINFKEVIEALFENNYEGWFIVEAEQDPTKANPFEYAKIGNKELVDCLSIYGYEIEDYIDE